MIQRIQTLYLLIVVALMSIMLFAPLAWFGIGSEQVTLYAFSLRASDGVVTRIPVVYTGIVIALACAVPLITIFLYKLRMVQVRLCVVEMVLLLGAEIMLLAYYFFGHGGAEFQGMRSAMALPVVSLLFAFFGARAVFRDEMLIRSLKRIR